MDQFEVPLETSCVYYDEHFLSQEEADAFYQDLHQNTAWEKTAKINRWVALHEEVDGEDDDATESQYKYRDAPGQSAGEDQRKRPFTATVRSICEKAEKWYNEKHAEADNPVKFNVCLLNFYEDGNQRIGWHSDREEIGRTTPIASISLGATREFHIRAKEGLERKSLDVTNGSLVIMENICQLKYVHCLPKMEYVTQGRINLTFRCKTESTPGEEEHERRDKWLERMTEIKDTDADTYAQHSLFPSPTMEGEGGTASHVFGDFLETEIGIEDVSNVQFTIKANIGTEAYVVAEIDELINNSETDVDSKVWSIIPRPWGAAGYVAVGNRFHWNTSGVDAESNQVALEALLKLRSAHFVMEFHDYFNLEDVANERDKEVCSVTGEDLYQFYKKRLENGKSVIPSLQTKTTTTFRVTSERIGSNHNFKAPNVEFEIGGAMSEFFPHAKPKMEDYDVNIRVDVIGNHIVVGTQKNFVDMSKRHFSRYRNVVTIKANLAYVMLRCANIQPDDLVVDPFCGSGTILLEAFEIEPSIQCVGMDVNRKSVQGAQENARAEGRGPDVCKFHCIDVRGFRKHLKDKSVDAIVSNLPWGVMTGHKSSVTDLQSLYEIFLRISWYVLRDHGRIVMLVLRGLQLTRIIRKLGGRYRILRANVVRTSNNLPCIVVVEKLPQDVLNESVKGQLAYMSQFVNVSKEMYHAIHNEDIASGIDVPEPSLRAKIGKQTDSFSSRVISPGPTPGVAERFASHLLPSLNIINAKPTSLSCQLESAPRLLRPLLLVEPFNPTILPCAVPSSSGSHCPTPGPTPCPAHSPATLVPASESLTSRTLGHTCRDISPCPRSHCLTPRPTPCPTPSPPTLTLPPDSSHGSSEDKDTTSKPSQKLFSCPLKRGMQLPRGCCRVTGDIIDTKETAESVVSKKILTPLSPIIIAIRGRSACLCQVEPCREAELIQDAPLWICYDDCVELVPWEGNLAEKHADGWLETVKELASTDAEIKSIRDIATSFRESEPHKHALVSPLPTEKTMKSDNCGFLVFSAASLATPLLSLTIKDVSEVKLNTSALHQASIKRQLIGLYIAYYDGLISSEINISLMDGTMHRFSVASIVAKKSTNKPFVFIVLPSTRITLMYKEAGVPRSEAVPSSQENKKTQLQPALTSSAALLLAETVRCLRNKTTAVVPKSFLLTGPPGVGKTFSVKQAYEVCKMDGPMLFLSLGSMLGSADTPNEVARILERRLEKTASQCHRDKRCVAMVLIDECDALLSSEVMAGMLSSLLDRSSQSHGGWERLVLVAATNRIDSIPIYLRRPGRFDREIHVSPPSAGERDLILKSMLQKSSQTLNATVVSRIAEACVGYVPADLSALVRRAIGLTLEEQKTTLAPEMLFRAMNDIGASALRDSALFAPPKTSWKDIAGDPGRAKTILRQAIEWPSTKSHQFKRLGLVPPKGILLYGPPGCAKTTLARAAAGASGSAFLSFSPADVYASSYMGEAEATVRTAFKLARSATPSILFFDEIDSILQGSDSSDGGHGMNRSGRGASAESRVLSTFLNEMDGVDGSRDDGVLVLGATNRPGVLDKALLRPGRFDKIIYVPPPDFEGRLSILNMYCNNWKASHIDTMYLASDDVSGCMTGAEIVGACQAAAMDAVKSSSQKKEDITVTQDDLERSLRKVKPLLSDKEKEEAFLKFQVKFNRL